MASKREGKMHEVNSEFPKKNPVKIGEGLAGLKICRPTNSNRAHSYGVEY